MTTDAIAGVGTVFNRIGLDPSSPSQTIGEVNSISGPSMSRGEIDVTSLDSTGGYREYISGFREGGQVTLNMNFTRDGYLLLLADFENDAEQTYQIVLPDTGNTTIEFDGLVVSIPLEIPEGKITCTCTIRVTGGITVSS